MKNLILSSIILSAVACAEGELPADELGFADDFDESDTEVEVDFDTPRDRAPVEPPKGGGDPGDCCQSSSAGYCENPWYVDCVCSIDDYCCLVAWDATCVGIAVSECDAEC